MKTGEKFNRLTAVKQDSKYYYWVFQCDCGNVKSIRKDHVENGKTTSCGCYVKEFAKKLHSKHGKAGSKIYRVWAKMKERCLYKNCKEYRHYGGRGITICKRWLKFENFYKDMGEVPQNMSLERINNDGNYEKRNCKWATKKEQANNRRSSLYISMNGVRITLTDLAETFGLTDICLYKRIINPKFTVFRALTQKQRL
jgi:hypothetical protein